jgi:hypothetical protein
LAPNYRLIGFVDDRARDHAAARNPQRHSIELLAGVEFQRRAGTAAARLALPVGHIEKPGTRGGED